MTPDSNFKVKFGNVARTLIYEDAKGSLLFAFDFATLDGKEMIVYKTKLTGDLKPLAESLAEIDKTRIQLALERVKQYVLTCGYKVCEDN